MDTNSRSTNHRLKVRLLFGLIEADANGVVAMIFVVLLLVLVGGGRWLQIW